MCLCYITRFAHYRLDWRGSVTDGMLEGESCTNRNVCYQQGNPSCGWIIGYICLIDFPVANHLYALCLRKFLYTKCWLCGLPLSLEIGPDWLKCNILFRWARHDSLWSPRIRWASKHTGSSVHMRVDSHEQERKCLWRSLLMNAMAFWFLRLSFKQMQCILTPV